VTGATLAAARAVWSGPARHGAAIAGGMHHAMAARGSGFGVYNDAAAAIAWLLAHGAERIAYLDIDAHHGDGVQAAFWADPRVLTISVHQHPATLFPVTGLPAETGGPGAEGRRSTSRCRPAPAMRAGCAPSTRSSRRCWRGSGPRCWSASTGPTRTGWIRWPA
jgi:acetoin utilization protein AcuC